VALVCGDDRCTYAQLDAWTDSLAACLAEAGVRRGDRVVIHLDNSIDAVVALFGALKVGAVFVMVNPTTKSEKLAYILNNCEAVVLVADVRGRSVVAEMCRRAPSLRTVFFSGNRPDDCELEEWEGVRQISLDRVARAQSAKSPVRPALIDLDLAALIYTSGSSGTAKGVVLTHLNVLSALRSISGYLGNTAHDVILNVLPLSFDYGLYQVFLAFHAAARLILEPAFGYPTRLLKVLVRERVTGLPIVPMIAALLLKHDLTPYDLSALRYLTNTGASLPPPHIAAFRERLPHVRIFSMYGLTECKRVSFLPPEEIDRRPASVGKPMDNCEVYLVDESGRPMARGVGELVVRGSNVMQGYWGAPDETARVLRPGSLPGELVLHTGDIFFIDDEGYMYFQGRTDDVIKSRGQKVSPREVENVLHAAPGVQEAVVVGVADPILGETVKAYVTLSGELPVTELEIQRHCAKHLEDFMVPRAIEIVDVLPRTTSGKIARRSLAPTSR